MNQTHYVLHNKLPAHTVHAVTTETRGAMACLAHALRTQHATTTLPYSIAPATRCALKGS